VSKRNSTSQSCGLSTRREAERKRPDQANGLRPRDNPNLISDLAAELERLSGTCGTGTSSAGCRRLHSSSATSIAWTSAPNNAS
jgi:hypothetical protein